MKMKLRYIILGHIIGSALGFLIPFAIYTWWLK
jgi:hypothetical protein